MFILSYSIRKLRYIRDSSFYYFPSIQNLFLRVQARAPILIIYERTSLTLVATLRGVKYSRLLIRQRFRRYAIAYTSLGYNSYRKLPQIISARAIDISSPLALSIGSCARVSSTNNLYIIKAFLSRVLKIRLQAMLLSPKILIIYRPRLLIKVSNSYIALTT